MDRNKYSSNDANLTANVKEKCCDKCGKKFDPNDEKNRKANIPCGCRLHKYSCLMQNNKNEQCPRCGHCICSQCLRWWQEAVQNQSELAKRMKRNAREANIDSMSN